MTIRANEVENMDLPDGPDILFRSKKILSPSVDGFFKGEVAIRDGRISYISMKGTVPPEERRGLDIIDLGDDLLCPAFYDAHMHLYQWSLSRSAIDLSTERSWKGIMTKLKALMIGKCGNELLDTSGFLIGVDYDDSFFPEDDAPSIKQLDRTFGKVPVVIRRICGHVIHLNTSAAGSMGIPLAMLKNGPLKDSDAMSASWNIPFDDRSLEKAISAGIRKIWSLGIAGGVEILPEGIFEQMVESFKASGGGLRLSVCLSGRESRTIRGKSRSFKDWNDIYDDSDGTCSTSLPEVLFEKHFMDGSIGAGTACFSKEFSKKIAGCSTLLDKETLKERAIKGLEDGLLPMVHAIGDEAISSSLEPLLSIDVPFRIEHSEAITKDHLKGLKGTKGCLSLQPNFQRVWGQKGGLYGSRLGLSYRHLNPFRSLSTSGVNWCFGSDMMPPGPFFGIVGATGHIKKSERLGTVTALKGYSEMSAKFSIRGSKDLGAIKEGALADLTIVGPDLCCVKALYIAGIRKHW